MEQRKVLRADHEKSCAEARLAINLGTLLLSWESVHSTCHYARFTNVMLKMAPFEADVPPTVRLPAVGPRP